MLKEKVFWRSIIGFFAVSILGTVNHYLYEWSGNNSFIGTFTPVNESVWEHLKLLFFPYLIFCIIEFIVYGKHIKGFLFSRLTGILYGLIFMPVAFYAYTSIIGKSILSLDILIFIISVALSFYISFNRIKNNKDTRYNMNIPAIIIFIGIATLFIGFTFCPPQTEIFRSPV